MPTIDSTACLPEMLCCKKCLLEKPLSAFYQRKNRRYGCAQPCKTCTQGQVHINYHANRDKRLARQEIYRQANATRAYERTQAWKAANPEKVKAWLTANRGRYKTRDRAYYAANREKRRVYIKAWRALHPEILRMYSQRRRAQQRAAPINDFTAAQWRALKAHYKQCCVYCGKKSPRLTMDHLTPLSKGGNHTHSNIVPACMPCNNRKKAGPVLKPVQLVLLLEQGGT